MIFIMIFYYRRKSKSILCGTDAYDGAAARGLSFIRCDESAVRQHKNDIRSGN